MNKSASPIGIYDSGIGGLTVAQAVVKHLPNENIIYFGDTAHLPYGDKSSTTIQAYSIKIANLLLEKNCKLILIACNSGSAAAFELVKEYVASRAIVMNVIDPTIQLLAENYSGKHIGLIATRQTIYSDVYKQKIEKLNRKIQLTSRVTNLLASAIEEFGNHSAIDGLLHEYLSHPTLKNIDALLLGCTHYPVIKEKIARYFDNKIEIIDSSETVAHAVKRRLEEHQLLNKEGQGKKHFYLSDFTESFQNNAKIFFEDTIQLEHYPLWE